jgi:2-amino-4-hydroxy-6-hydroxymethyldihydropteridine diphosphokinase
MSDVERGQTSDFGFRTSDDDPVTQVAIALGSNIGDREGHLRYAVERLGTILASLHVSPFIETEPQDVSPQPPFLNGAVVGRSRLAARPLLDALLAIERERGRERPYVGAPRTLDLDLVLFGTQCVDEPRLQVPHPRFRQRRFVLEPLAVIAPRMVDPVTGLTVEELLKELRIEN